MHRPPALRRTAAVVLLAFTIACGADPNDLDAPPPEEAPVPGDPDPEEAEQPDIPDPGEDATEDPPPGDEVDGPEDDPDVDDEASRPDDAITGDSREVTLAVADAAERTGVAAGDIEVVEFAMVTWPDGAIGCPEPGVVYTQALVDGYRIVLNADGTQLTYHGATGADPFLCQSPADPVQPSR